MFDYQPCIRRPREGGDPISPFAMQWDPRLRGDDGFDVDENN
jgi:hypothetical protein